MAESDTEATGYLHSEPFMRVEACSPLHCAITCTMTAPDLKRNQPPWMYF